MGDGLLTINQISRHTFTFTQNTQMWPFLKRYLLVLKKNKLYGTRRSSTEPKRWNSDPVGQVCWSGKRILHTVQQFGKTTFTFLAPRSIRKRRLAVSAREDGRGFISKNKKGSSVAARRPVGAVRSQSGRWGSARAPGPSVKPRAPDQTPNVLNVAGQAGGPSPSPRRPLGRGCFPSQREA